MTISRNRNQSLIRLAASFIATPWARRAPAFRMDIDEALEIRGGGIPRGGAVLVTDEVDASGAWLVAHLLRRALVSAAAGSDADADVESFRRADGAGTASVSPPSQARRVCLVTAEQPAAHYTKTLAKLGRDTRGDLSSGALVVVDVLSRPFRAWGDHDDTTSTSARDGVSACAPGMHQSLAAARALFTSIRRALEGDQGSTAETTTETETHDARRVVVIDDLTSALLSVGVGGGVLTLAVDALLRSLLSIPDCAVVFGAHLDCAGKRESSTGGWLASAVGVSDCRMDVASLKTGVAEDVHGRVRVTHRTGAFARCSLNTSPNTPPKRYAVAKYRLAETGIHMTRERSAGTIKK
jgi:hypothetical protein